MSGFLSLLFNLFMTLGTTLPGRVLSALGIGWLTYAGISTAVGALVTQTFAAWNALPATIYQLVSLAGFTDALGITTAAFITRASLSALPKLGKLS